ncbi:hypothetical protein QNA14_02095 [Dietzia kunjamensis]|uniref:hypothetical protein n=1 Tax=Dietzia TaxID=37914 RepID=UPI0008051B86|nr:MULTISPECIES: hypothetical protein [Dietzia]MDJ0421324.1 hypothetical protein [Dietzia kunjamensis]OAV79552.1 hypothetical protein AYO52_01065 [Dietzia sp. 111N12-1]
MTTPDSDIRATRRAQREAERAARAQRKADAARERALEAARAGGLFEGMEAMPRTETADPRSDEDTAGGATARPATSTPSPSPASREPIDPARRRTLITALALVSAVLVVVTGLATWQYVEAREATAIEEQIAAAPRAATDAAREITTQMFTYDHRTVDADLGAVRERLADPALSEFVEQSMPTVSSAAKQQEATVYATVAAAAPQEVTDAERVTVLVMLNRMVSTKDAPEAASSASRLSVDMVRQDGTWKLAELNAL